MEKADRPLRVGCRHCSSARHSSHQWIIPSFQLVNQVCCLLAETADGKLIRSAKKWPFFPVDRNIHPKKQKGGSTSRLSIATANRQDSDLAINLCSGLDELDGFDFHPLLQRIGFGDTLSRRIFAHVLRNLHRAEVRAAHGAEVGDLG